jgi:hypothetical protein
MYFPIGRAGIITHCGKKRTTTMWMWKVESVDVDEAEIRLNALASKGWEIVQTHIDPADHDNLTRLVIVAKKPMPENPPERA